MAGYPWAFPVLGALTGAAWVLASDGTNRRATKYAGLGFVAGAGLGWFWGLAAGGSTAGLGRIRRNAGGVRVLPTSYDDGHAHTVTIPRRILR